MRLAFGLLLLTQALSLAGQPVEPGMIVVSGSAVGTHDPTIVKVEGRYLRFATGRGIPVASSPDLSVWTLEGQVFAANPAWTAEHIPGSGDFWAPDVVRRGSQWRMYYSVSTFGSNRSAIGLAVNDRLDPLHPTEGWVDKGPVLESFPDDDFNAIDPQAAPSPEGDWLVFGSFWSGTKMTPLSSDGTVPTPATRVDLARRPEAPDAIEGAYIHAHGGKYYLFVSFDFCCRGKRSTYNVRVGRSDSFQGPYTDRQGVPLLEGGGTIVKTSGERDIGPGHNSVLVDGETEYLVYHTYDARYGGASRLRVQALEWKDGWPTAGLTP